MARKRQRAEDTAAASDASASSKPSAVWRQGDKIGHELRAATSTSEPQEIGVRSHNIRFDLTSETAYHAIREQFFDRLHRFLTGVQVFLATGAVAALVSWVPDAAIWLVAVAALAGVLLLVIDPAGAARDHRALRSRLHMIRATLEELPENEDLLRSARAQMVRVSADAPPGYRGVQAIAYNNAVNAMYRPEMARQHRYKIGVCRAFFANFIPMRGHEFAKENPPKIP